MQVIDDEVGVMLLAVVGVPLLVVVVGAMLLAVVGAIGVVLSDPTD